VNLYADADGTGNWVSFEKEKMRWFNVLLDQSGAPSSDQLLQNETAIARNSTIEALIKLDMVDE
jgi:hypothetical protein